LSGWLEEDVRKEDAECERPEEDDVEQLVCPYNIIKYLMQHHQMCSEASNTNQHPQQPNTAMVPPEQQVVMPQ
jgi:hypothetical protein